MNRWMLIVLELLAGFLLAPWLLNPPLDRALLATGWRDESAFILMLVAGWIMSAVVTVAVIALNWRFIKTRG